MALRMTFEGSQSHAILENSDLHDFVVMRKRKVDILHDFLHTIIHAKMRKVKIA